jgi:hypothetical protein
MKFWNFLFGVLAPFIVSAQTQTTYYPMLPDMVFPCRSYSDHQYPPIPKRAMALAASAVAYPDTFELRLNSNVIRFTAIHQFGETGYDLRLNCQAQAGAYSVYDSKRSRKPMVSAMPWSERVMLCSLRA